MAEEGVRFHSLASILPYYMALSRGLKAADICISPNFDEGITYLQFLNPCE